MKFYVSSKIKNTFLGSMLIAVSSILPLHSSESAKKNLNDWITTCPYIGLVANEVHYGPITLSNFDMDDNGRLILVKPGEQLHCSVKYSIDASQMDSWHMHHVIVGIQGGENSQCCITHSLGVWDKKGKANFELNAPAEKGVYEVRFIYEQVLRCSDAVEHWKDDAPSSRTTVGIIIVE